MITRVVCSSNIFYNHCKDMYEEEHSVDLKRVNFTQLKFYSLKTGDFF